MKKSMLICMAMLAFLDTGFIFAQKLITYKECERMVEERDMEAIQRLIKGQDSYIETDLTPPILFLAIQSKDYELIQFMFEQGMSTEYHPSNSGNSTYLLVPVMEGDLATVEFLLTFCEITTEDAGRAVSHGKKEIVELFIKRGFDFRTLYKWSGYSGVGQYEEIYTTISEPFFVLAIDDEKYEIAKMLLPLTQDINANYYEWGGYPDDAYILKQTALDLARNNKDQSIIPWLLKNGSLSYDEKVANLSYKELSTSKEFEYERFSTTNSLRVRSQPNLKGKVLGSLALNERVGVLRTTDSKDYIDELSEYWYNICTKTGLKGWVFGGYLKRVEG